MDRPEGVNAERVDELESRITINVQLEVCKSSVATIKTEIYDFLQEMKEKYGI